MAAIGDQTNYTGYFGWGAALAALLFLPGWAWRRWRPASPWARLELLPLPGIAWLTGVGIVTVLFRPPRTTIEAILIGAAVLLLLTGLAAPKRSARNDPHEALALLVYVCLVGAAGLESGLRTPAVQGFWAGTDMQSTMPASPPDGVIPYRTAAYLWSKEPHPRPDATRERYFWTQWSLTSRGPLVPLEIVAVFNLVHPRLQPGGDPGPGPWPAGPDGFAAARWLGILLNGCVVFGGLAVLRRFARRPAALRNGLLWLGVAPVVWINVSFLWPKLLATYFLCLAAAWSQGGRAAWRGREVVVGAAVAAAYLSHPVGALFGLPFLIWHVARRRAARSGGLLAVAAAALTAAPWLWLKLHTHRPDVFLRYPLGDGRGFETAASPATWARTRLRNLWFTLAPAAVYGSSIMRSWIGGPLGPAVRWSIQAAKSLPGGLGSLGLIPAVRVRRFTGLGLLAGALALALLFWGYSDDGLGRNCLEPLTVAFLLWTSRDWNLTPAMSRIVLGGIWGETVLITVASYADRPGFSAAAVPAVDFALFTGACAALAAPLALVLRAESPSGISRRFAQRFSVA